MISYGENGKIDASWLLIHVVQEGLVRFPDSEISFDGTGHGILGAEFSDRVKNFPEIRENFGDIVSDLLSLAMFLEAEEGLKVPPSLLGEELLPYVKEEPLSGLTLLNLFSKGLLKLEKTGNKDFTLSAGLLFTSALEKPEKVLNTLSNALMRFNGTVSLSGFPEIRFLSTEKAAGEKRESKTEKPAENTFSVSYEQEAGIERYVESGLATEEELNRTLNPEELSRILLPDENTVSHLKTIRGIFDAMEDKNRSLQTEIMKYSLSYEAGKCFRKDRILVRIPDGFEVTEEEDSLILYLPNPENPEEWEASSFRICIRGREETEESPRERALTADFDGRGAHYRMQVPLSDGSLDLSALLTGVTPENRAVAERAVKEIFSGIQETPAF